MSVEVKIPSPGESITEVQIATWMKEDGDFVEKDEALCEVETDKATLPIYAEASGVLKILIPEGEEAKVGDVACSIDTSAAPAAKAEGAAESAPAAEAAPAAAAASDATSHAAGVPSPAAAKIMAEKGIAAGEVSGTGKGGRVTKGDVLEHTPKPAAAPAPAKAAKEAPAKAAPAPAPAVPSGGASREVRQEKMSRIRKKIAERLVSVKNETAMLTTFNEVDMGAVMELRSQYKDKFLKKHNVKLGFMSFFTKACAQALMEFPAVNGMIEEDQIVYHDYVDMGIAVSAPRGLVVPVIRNAEALTLAQIESEIVRLATKARDNKLTIDEMSGGTFSITNGGIFGSMLSTPIINPPQSAILGMHNIVERPIAVKGQVVVRPVMYLALSYDHRIIDGRESVSFLYRVKEYLEEPARLLLEV